jgi:hypothetical protein
LAHGTRIPIDGLPDVVRKDMERGTSSDCLAKIAALDGSVLT